MSFHPLFAQAPDAAGGEKTGEPAGGDKPQGAADKQPPGGFNLLQFAPFILIGLFFLVVMLPAQRRQKREAAARLAAMKPGAKVTLSSGIVGRIVSMKDGEDEIVIKSDDTRLRVLRASVTTVVADDTAAAEVKS